MRRRVEGVVMFVDLVGSTAYKTKHPDEVVWLPRLARFLTSVSAIVSDKGQVVKYIGDEVMAFFEGRDAVLHAEHAAESILAFCEGHSLDEFQVKIAMDFGSATMLKLAKPAGAAAGDPNGQFVDRCARIMTQAAPNSVLCSGAFKTRSKAPSRWRRAGSFLAKGIGKVSVWQLRHQDHAQVNVSIERMSLAECKQELLRRSQELTAAQQLGR